MFHSELNTTYSYRKGSTYNKETNKHFRILDQLVRVLLEGRRRHDPRSRYRRTACSPRTT
jgi:hypothetical protein